MAGRSSRSALDASAQAYVERWIGRREQLGLNGRQPLFCTISKGHGSGGPIDASYVRKALPHLAARAGLERRVHPHALPHSLATALAHGGEAAAGDPASSATRPQPSLIGTSRRSRRPTSSSRSGSGPARPLAAPRPRNRGASAIAKSAPIGNVGLSGDPPPRASRPGETPAGARGRRRGTPCMSARSNRPPGLNWLIFTVPTPVATSFARRTPSLRCALC